MLLPWSAKSLTHRPACKKLPRKIITAFNTPAVTKLLSVTDARKAGPLVLERVNKRESERQ